MIKILLALFLLFPTVASADLGFSVGTKEGSASYALGIYGEHWGVELGSVTYADDVRQYPGGTRPEEPPQGLDLIYRFGSGSVKPFLGIGLYYSQVHKLTQVSADIVEEETETDIRLSPSVGVHFLLTSQWAVGVGLHGERGTSFSVLYSW